MRNFIPRKQEEHERYKRLLAAYAPTSCARCGKPGSGWVMHGGDFHPHHIAGRRCAWRLALFVPMCPHCHLNYVHKNPNRAKKEQWLVDPEETRTPHEP